MRFPPLPAPDQPHRVVVTGAGMITALGRDWATQSEGFRRGRTGFRAVTRFPVERQRVQTAAEADPPDPPPAAMTTLGSRRWNRLDTAARFLLHATHEALESGRFRPPPGTPFILGTTSGQMSLGEAFYRQATTQPGNRRRQASRTVEYPPQAQAAEVRTALGLRGPVTLVANACASGANALGLAWQQVRTGMTPCALAGGYEALSQLVFAGFDSLQALSTTRCRPFDVARDGLALGEGAAVFLLETLEHAAARDARILGELAGYGAHTDLHHLTQPHPEGHAAWSAMIRATQVAGVDPGCVGYVNAHGTGTPANDGSEAAAIVRWAGSHASGLQVSSTKAGIGHLLGAAGAVEFGICLMALEGGWLPPMLSTETPDPACRFRLVQSPTPCDLEYALTNSFGFGGANASLLVRRWR